MLYYDSMTLHSNVRTSGDKPVYVRLRDTITDAILAGKFGDGDPLPSVRAFAAEQGANPLTVAKAYQGFQDDGLIVVWRASASILKASPSAKPLRPTPPPGPRTTVPPLTPLKLRALSLLVRPR